MSDSVGFRVARWRDLAGLTQQELADRVGVTREYISLIENGRRPVTKRSLLIGLADSLGVPVTDLLGEVDAPQSSDDLAIHRAAAAVRIALDDELEPVDVHPEQVDSDADALIRARMACDYAALAELLPRTITNARVMIATGADEARRVARTAMVRACVFGAYAMKTATQFDLATRLAERAQDTAQRLGEPAYGAAAHMALAQTAMAVGIRRRALRYAVDGAGLVQDQVDIAARTWYGQLHLQAALTSASLGMAAEAAEHLDLAEAAAHEVDGHGTAWHLEFTVDNVAIWRMGVALENGEPERAPELTRHVSSDAIRTPQRRARLHMDRGRGHYAAGNSEAAVRSFHAAFDTAPPEVRRRGTVREIVSQMVRDSRGSGDAALSSLAAKLKIDPAAAA
jgi:transcriptional regulator with XRE-family HTH domain